MKINRNEIIYSLIFTIFLTLFTIWNRFIRLRLPKDIILQSYINEISLITGFLLIIWFSLFIYYLLKTLEIIPRPQSKFSELKKNILKYLVLKQWFTSLTIFIEKTVLKGPSNIYEIIYKYIYVKPFIHQIGAKLSYHFMDYPVIPYIIGFVIPRITPWIILLFELLYYHRIEYFFKALLLYIIPLICNIILYMIKHHAINYIEYYEEFFDFKIIENTLHVFFKKIPDSNLQQKQERLSSRAGDDWEFAQYLYNISYQITYRKDLYHNYLNTFIYGLMSVDFLLQLSFLIGFDLHILSFLQRFNENIEPFSGILL